jgi:hypothetical protein
MLCQIIMAKPVVEDIREERPVSIFLWSKGMKTSESY